jgi:hypothetical protein
MHAVAKGSRGLKALALGLTIVNVALWYAVPWLRDTFDALTGRLFPGQQPPVFVYGVQELLVYYDPWLARGVFPVVYTLGFVAIAFLFQPAPNPAGPASWSTALAILLLGFEVVWVGLIAFAILFRGPDWNIYWPWNAGAPTFTHWTSLTFSRVFYWNLVSHPVPNAPWVVREAPGLVLALGYLLLGLLTARALATGAGGSLTSCGCVGGASTQHRLSSAR